PSPTTAGRRPGGSRAPRPGGDLTAGRLPRALDLAAGEERLEVRAHLGEGLLHPRPPTVLLAIDQHDSAQDAQPFCLALAYCLDDRAAARDHVLDHHDGVPGLRRALEPTRRAVLLGGLAHREPGDGMRRP